ncbi:MAG: hypothetical protein Q8S17_03900 [Humidesulfovibrio sp.]|nr:hypothetical protein [Humidesulfovibrio sp.]
MIGIGALFAVILYLFVSYAVVRFAYASASNKLGKCLSTIIALMIVLWYPVIEPARSYHAFMAYASNHAGAKVYKQVNGVRSVFVESHIGKSIGAVTTTGSIPEQQQDSRRYYDFVEEVRPDGSFAAVYSNGTIETISKTRSKYSVRWYKEFDTASFVVYTTEIKDQEGTTMAICREVSWLGAGPMRFHIAGQRIFETIPSDFDQVKFIQAVLRPYQLD